MNKKFVALSAILLLGGGGSLFLTGCQKDYDGQIEILRNQIKSGVVDLDGLKAKLALLQEQITKLEDALKQTDEAHKAEFENLIQNLQTVKADLVSQMSRLQAQVDEAKTDINTLKGLVQQTEQTFNTKMLELSDRINGVDASLNVLDGRVARLEQQVKAILEKQGLVDKTIESLKKEIEDLKARPQTPDVADQLKKLEEAVEQMKLLGAGLEQRVTGLNTLIKQVKEAAEKKDAQLEELIQKTALDIARVQSEFDSKIQNLTSQMTGLSDALAALSASVDALNQKYSVLDVKVTALQNEFKAQIDRIWEAINKNEAADAEELALLKKSVAELQGALDHLNQDVKKGMAEVLERQQLFGQSLESLNQALEKYKGDLNEIAKQLDGLNVRVTALEKWAQDFETAYGATIKDINDKIAALEKEVGGGSSVDLTQIKEQLKAMEEQLKEQSAELKKFKGSQDELATKLTDFQTEMRQSLLAIQVNYTVVLQRLGKAEEEINRLAGFTNTLQANLTKLNEDLAALTTDVAKNTADIVTLKAELAKLQDAQDAFITAEKVEEMLKDYQQKVDATMDDFLKKLAQKPNRDEMEKMIADASKALEGQIEAMKTQISSLQDQVDALTQKVTSLENWAKNFETAYQTTIKVITDRIASLEGKEDANAEEIAALKTQLQEFQSALKAQSDELNTLKGNQAKMAEALTQFKNEMDARVLALENNYASLLGRMGVAEDEIKKLSDFAAVFQVKLGELSKDLAALTTEVGKQAHDIVALKAEIARLEGQQKNFITKEDVQNMLKDYQKEVDKTFKEVFAKLDEKASRDEVKQMIADASKALEGQITAMKTQIVDLQSKVDALSQKVSSLESWAENFEKAYQTTIKVINDRIASLEGKENANAEEIAALKAQLQEFQDALKTQSDELTTLKGDQAKLADALTQFKFDMDTRLYTIELNYTAVAKRMDLAEDQIKELSDFAGEFKKQLGTLSTDLITLTGRVDAQAKDIVDLKAEIARLEGQQKKFVTKEDVQAMLSEYQQEVDKTFKDVFTQLGEKTSRDEVKQMIADANKVLEVQIQAMSAQITELKTKLDQLSQQVNQLEGWAEAFEKAYDVTMKEISAKISSLENKQGDNAVEIAALKAQLEGMKATLADHTKKLEDLKGDQEGFAKQLVQLRNDMNNALYALENNLNDKLKEVNEAVVDLTKSFNTELARINSDLASLFESVTAHESAIVKLQKDLLALQEESNKKFLTKEDVDKMLAEHQQKFDVELQKVYTALDGKASHEEVKTLIDNAKSEMQIQLNYMDSQIKDLQNKVEELFEKVNHLEGWAKAFYDAYQQTIDSVKKQIQDLEAEHDGYDKEIANLKNDVQRMQAALDEHAQRLQDLEEVQDAYADELLDFRNEMTIKLLTLENNLNLQLQAVDKKVVDLTTEFHKTLAGINSQLSNLFIQVDKNQRDIANLTIELQKLQNQTPGGSTITEEAIKKMLAESMQKVDEKIAALEKELQKKPSLDKVNELIAATKNDLQQEINAMQSELNDLKTEVQQLKDQLANLIKRVQSMQLIPDFSNGAVTLNMESSTRAVLTLRVKVNPAECIDDIIKNHKNILEIISMPVVPVRSNGNLVNFDITSVNKLGNGIIEIKAANDNFELANQDVDQNLPIQVAVSLNDGNNDRTTNFANVRYTTTPERDQDVDYTFTFEDNEEVKTLANTINVQDFINAKSVYDMNILENMSFPTGVLCQIPQGTFQFAGQTMTSSPATGDTTKKYSVKYTLSMIFNKENNPDGYMLNYVVVTPDGKVYMKSNLNPPLTKRSLENYKLIVEMQATDGKFVYGKKRTACVELKMKK